MSNHWQLLGKLSLLAICLVYLIYSLASLGLAEVWQVGQQANLLWLGLSLLPLFLRFFLWSWKWQLMIKRETVLPLKLVHRLIMGAAFINLVTPTAKLGGAFYRALYLKRYCEFRASRAYGWVFSDQMAHLSGNLVLFGIVALTVPWLLPEKASTLSFFLLGSACIFLVALFLLYRPNFWQMAQSVKKPAWLTHWFSTKLARFQSAGRKDSIPNFLWPWLASGTSLQVARVEIFGSAISFGMLGLANAWVLKSLGADVSIFSVLLVVMLAYFVASFLGVMGGIGVTEVFLLKLYPMIGVTHTTAAAGALLHRALFYLLVLVLGGLAMAQLRHSAKQALVNVSE